MTEPVSKIVRTHVCEKDYTALQAIATASGLGSIYALTRAWLKVLIKMYNRERDMEDGWGLPAEMNEVAEMFAELEEYQRTDRGGITPREMKRRNER